MSLLKKWEPEDKSFWDSEGSSRAWGTLWITTFSLISSFATWFLMSAVSVRLPAIGFKFDTMQLFWLAAMPGLSGGTLRFIHTFLIPIYGTRTTLAISAFLKIIPMAWLGYAVQNPETPYSHFFIISILCGFGGGDFSSYMPSTSLFFPKRLQGLAMGIQAGIGNFGVSLTQFVTPWIIGFSLFGALGGSQIFTKASPAKDIKIIKTEGVVKEVNITNESLAPFINISKDEQGFIKDVVILENEKTKNLKVDATKNESGVLTDLAIKDVVKKDIYLQNGAFWYIPWLIIAGLLSLFYLKSIPMKKPTVSEMVKNMTDNKHAWFCTITYIMTFGAFSGFSAAFPLMIKTIYGNIPGVDPSLAPDPLKYAFYGPLIGSAIRALMGPLCDKLGGSIWLMISGIGMIIGSAAMVFSGALNPTSLDQFPVFVGIMLFLFLMSGLGNAATFRQYPIVFAFNPRQGAQILGWTGAWAAYGPFVFSSLIGSSITKFGSADVFFIWATVYFFVATIINWWFYTRKGAERFDYGTSGGTWWDKAKDSWNPAT